MPAPSLFLHKLLEERQRQGQVYHSPQLTSHNNAKKKKNISSLKMSSDDNDNDNKKEEAEVGKKYRGSIVTNIESEVSTAHMAWQTDEDGKKFPTYRVRKSITLDTGMILIEDEYQTNYQPNWANLWKSLYKEVPRTTWGIGLS